VVQLFIVNPYQELWSITCHNHLPYGITVLSSSTQHIRAPY